MIPPPQTSDIQDESPHETTVLGEKPLGRGKGFVCFLILCLLFLAFAFGADLCKTGQRREMYLPELEIAVREHPNDIRFLCTAAARYRECGDYPAAERLLKQAVGAGETEAMIWRSRAAIAILQGNRVAARLLLQGSIAKYPKASGELGGSLRALTDSPVSTSTQDLVNAVTPRPDELLSKYAPPTLSPLIQAWGKRDPWTSGFETRRIWARQEPSSALANAVWADALRRNRRRVEARVVAEYAVRLDGKSPDALLSLADVQWSERGWRAAETTYQTVLSLRPNCVPALVGRGRARALRGDRKSAIADLEQAKRLHPDDADVWIALADTYALNTKTRDESLTAFATAARFAPWRRDFFVPYARIMCAESRWAEAESLVRRRIEDKPEALDARILLAEILREYEPTPLRESEAALLLRGIRLPNEPVNPL